MKVRFVSIDSVTPYERNPRRNEAAVEKVAASIKEFGWQQPIVVDDDHVIIVGHTRLLAAQQLGMKKVPIKIADDLTPEQVKAYRLADNRTGEISEWDLDLLRLEFEDLQQIGMQVDEIPGFSFSELEKLEKLGNPQNVTQLPPEDPPEEESTPAGIKPVEPPQFEAQDIIEFGSHQIIVGPDETGIIEKIVNFLNKTAPKLNILKNGEPLEHLEG